MIDIVYSYHIFTVLSHTYHIYIILYRYASDFNKEESDERQGTDAKLASLTEEFAAFKATTDIQLKAQLDHLERLNNKIDTMLHAVQGSRRDTRAGSRN